MTTHETREQISSPRPAGARYPSSGQESARTGDGVPAEAGQMTDRLKQVWQRAQDRLGLEDRHPIPTLNEELRHGQQEVLEIGRDLADIAQDLRALVQQEMLRARVEMAQQMRIASQAMGWGFFAFMMAFLMLAFLAVAGMFALALVLPPWLAALTTAGALFVIEIIAALMAFRRFRQIRLVPQQTMESVKEDVRWISDQLKSNGT